MKYIFTCGGTAGHINPALAVASHLKDNDPSAEFLFLGVDGKMEMELVPKAGFNIIPLKISSISRKKTFDGLKHNAETVHNVITSYLYSKKILNEFKPNAVIGTGGYVCYPVIMAAHSLKIPTIIHESNAYPGLTTRMLSYYSDKILVGMEDSIKYYKKKDRVTFTGTPVREEFLSYTKKAARKILGYSDDDKIVLSFWGSLGAELMNETVVNMIPKLDGLQFKLIHAFGNLYFDEFSRKLSSISPNYEDRGITVYKYIHDMPILMAAADLVICRGGASTLSELCFIGKPSIIVPSPNVTDNHQEKNARVIENAGGTRVIIEKDITPEYLLDNILDIISDEKLLDSMSKNAKVLSNDNAVNNICEEIASVIN